MEDNNMPEKMTKREAEISRAIRLVRKAKETIKLVGNSNEIPYDSEGEEVKVKRPKAVKDDKIKNKTQKKEGYGLAGEVIGKRYNRGHITDENKRNITTSMRGGVFTGTIDKILDDTIKEIMNLVRDSNADSGSIEAVLDETVERFQAIQDQLTDYEYNPQ
tara:strand:- start:92 stop:574 length:483 start_codon:yes stop_codon:yes gene_type:complete